MIEGRKKRVSGVREAASTPVDGVRAARLHTIKNDILDNLRQHALSIHSVASRHDVSVGYIRQLFTAEDTTFDHFVRDRRLEIARLMLRDPRFADRSIAAIAFDVGFGDVGRFNRAFRRRYGMKASDMRG